MEERNGVASAVGYAACMALVMLLVSECRAGEVHERTEAVLKSSRCCAGC
jgi:hypothetical protein